MGCESAAKIIADIFGRAHVVGSTLGCAVASVVGPVLGVPISYEKCFVAAEQAADFTGKMIAFWNDNIGRALLLDSGVFCSNVVRESSRTFQDQ